jgi:hypothetical protein
MHSNIYNLAFKIFELNKNTYIYKLLKKCLFYQIFQINICNQI